MKWSEEYRVHYYYTDYNNILKPGYIARYMQETAWNSLKRKGPSPEYLYKNNLAFILSKISFRYYEEIYEDDIIKVETWPNPAKSIIFPRNYRIYKNEKIMAEAASAWVLMDIKKKSILRPDDFKSLLTIYDDEELDFTVQKKFKMPEAAQTSAGHNNISEYKVNCADIDTNLHMNNAVYIDLVCNQLYSDHDVISPELKKKIISLDLNYNGEARFAQVIELNKSVISCDSGAKEYYIKAKIKNGEQNQNCFESKAVLINL